MDIRQIPIHQLQLSQELKTVGYRRADSAMLDEVTEHGFLNPTIACAIEGSNKFEIVSQEQTWFAAQELGIHEIPVFVVCPDSKRAKTKLAELALPENPIEKAERYNDWLKAAPKRKIAQLARLEGCTRSNVSHQLRLLSLEKSIKNLIGGYRLTAGHGKILLGMRAGEGREKAAALAAHHGWRVTRLKQHINGIPSQKIVEPSKKQSEKDTNTISLERELTGIVGSPVSLNVNSGTLTIDYQKNFDTLDGILERLGYRQ